MILFNYIIFIWRFVRCKVYFHGIGADVRCAACEKRKQLNSEHNANRCVYSHFDYLFSCCSLFSWFYCWVNIAPMSSPDAIRHSDASYALPINRRIMFLFFLIVDPFSLYLFSFSFRCTQRNGTLTEVSTINTGHNGMDKFGYLDQLNGMNQLPFWDTEPCTNITASEGSFFPPREFTKSDMRYVYDKDLCRIIPLEYIRTVYKDGIPADLYEMPENTFGDAATNPNNSCYDTEDYKAVKGLQNISPCQYSECSTTDIASTLCKNEMS